MIINNQDGEVGAFIDFENVFGFDHFASAMVNAIGHEPEGDFDAAMRHVMDTITIPELLAQFCPQLHRPNLISDKHCKRTKRWYSVLTTTHKERKTAQCHRITASSSLISASAQIAREDPSSTCCSARSAHELLGWRPVGAG